MQLNGNSETTASNGKLFTAFGVIVGMTLAARAWTAWRAGSHAVEHSVAVGILAAGMVIAGLDATWRMRAQDARVAADWTEVAFDAAVGGRIDGWPAWLVGAILSAIATMLIPTL